MRAVPTGAVMKSYKVTLFPALLAALLISGKVIAHEATGSLGANARFVDYLSLIHI